MRPTEGDATGRAMGIKPAVYSDAVVYPAVTFPIQWHVTGVSDQKTFSSANMADIAAQKANNTIFFIWADL